MRIDMLADETYDEDALKGGVLQLTEVLAAALGPSGVAGKRHRTGPVRDTAGPADQVDPDWYAAYADMTALKRWATPDKIVGAILFLASDASTFETGTLQLVEGGWTAVDGLRPEGLRRAGSRSP
jgi:NAD(P)-dependent dehydrogenase (short-subunit alcohol dehydrogenase family)